MAGVDTTLSADTGSLRARVQSTSKWLVATFGAFGGFILAGVQVAVLLTEIRGLLPPIIAAAGFAVAIGCVTTIIIIFGKVIVAPPVSTQASKSPIVSDPVLFAPFNNQIEMFTELDKEVEIFIKNQSTDPTRAEIALSKAENYRYRLRQFIESVSEKESLEAFNKANNLLPHLISGIAIGILLFSGGVIWSKSIERKELAEEKKAQSVKMASALITSPIVASMSLKENPVSKDAKAITNCLDRNRNLRVILNSATLKKSVSGEPNGYQSLVTPLVQKTGCGLRVYSIPSIDGQIVLK